MTTTPRRPQRPDTTVNLRAELSASQANTLAALLHHYADDDPKQFLLKAIELITRHDLTPEQRAQLAQARWGRFGDAAQAIAEDVTARFGDTPSAEDIDTVLTDLENKEH